VIFVEFLPKIKEKQWDKAAEQQIFDDWQRKRLFAFSKKDKRPTFAIDTPPPYVNTPVHVGHAFTYVIMDIIARYRRMAGFNVLFPLGLDKNGLPIEIQAEKVFGISIATTPRETFIAKCKELIAKSGDASIESFKRLGISFNNWKVAYELGGRYDTDDREYRRMTQETFIRLWHKGLVYEDVKPTNYCPVCGTTISDAEVEYVTKQTMLNHVKFYVKETATDMGEFVTIATTRPELLPACKLILYNPEDTRYTHMNGRTAIVPMFGNEVPIMPHPYAKPDFGTGLVMICSFGDYGDVRVLRELDMTPTFAIDTQGRMTRAAGKYKGMLVTEARKAVIEDLRAQQLLVKEEPVTQSQPVCWRSKNPIEFVSMKELYLKQVESKDDMLKMANAMRFYAPESRQILIDWINSINIDWVISRRRYYGTEVPLWHCASCKTSVVPPPGKYYQPWKQSSPVKRCPKCGKSKFIGDTRTFDTWFDSSSSDYYILGYMWDKSFWKKSMPCTLRPQGKEIVRTWLYFSMLKAWLLDRQQAFENCWIHMHVVDDKGEKMSKSLGNVIDPQEMLKRFGADAFRVWVCLEGDISRGDVRCSFERIEGTSKFLTKFWNIARFISMFPQVQPQDAKKLKLEAADRWILAELANLVRFAKEKYDAYEFNAAVTAIRDFTWDTFAAHYLEMVKPRAYVMQGGATLADKGKSAQSKPVKPDEKTLLAAKAAWYTLHECLRTLLLLMAPPVPFVTERVWTQLYAKAKSESLHGQAWPEVDKPDKKQLELTKPVKDFNSVVWNMKKESGLSLRDPVNMEVPKELKAFERDMKAMHNLGGKIEPRPELIKCDPKAQPQKPQAKPEPKQAQKHAAKPAKKKKA